VIEEEKKGLVVNFSLNKLKYMRQSLLSQSITQVILGLSENRSDIFQKSNIGFCYCLKISIARKRNPKNRSFTLSIYLSIQKKPHLFEGWSQTLKQSCLPESGKTIELQSFKTQAPSQDFYTLISIKFSTFESTQGKQRDR